MDFTEYFLYVKKKPIKKLAGGSYFMEYILICLQAAQTHSLNVRTFSVAK